MWFAWLLRWLSRYHEPLVADRKRKLFGSLTGRVLEIGAGDGVNLKYLAPDVSWVGLEPNSHLARHIVVPPGGRLIIDTYRGEVIDCDAVICSLVLCSVTDPATVLRGIYDSLRPGGQLVFLEHVAAPAGTALRRRQDFWLPIWKRCAGGCHPNRETLDAIEAAGFRIERIEKFDLPLGLASPHIAGVATKNLLT